MIHLLLPALIAMAPAQNVQRQWVIYFNPGSTAVPREAFDTLDDVLAALDANPRMRVRVSGHTDRAGTAEANLAKSQKMAESVAFDLADEGIPESRILIIGYGETRPVVPTKDGVREPMNRRVLIELIPG